MPLLQISIYPEMIRGQKELFAKIGIANAALETLIICHNHHILQFTFQREHSENWYNLGKQSSEERILKFQGNLCMQSKEI